MIPSAVADACRLQVLSYFRPPPRLSLSEWADKHYYLSAESGVAEPGRWHTRPYQKEIMDAITDPEVDRVTIKKSSRVGYTKIINAAAGYFMHQAPCAQMIVQPTIDEAEGYSKDEIAPMLCDVEVLTDLVKAEAVRDTKNTILRKIFPGGSLTMVGANSPRGFRRVGRKVVMFDEVDGYPDSAGSEGDPIELGINRTLDFWDRKIVIGSTPVKAGGRVDFHFEAGDQRFYHVPCISCGHMQILRFPRFHWPTGKPELAVYICEACSFEIEYRHQRDMVEAGRWVPTEAFRGHKSFHIWAAYSYLPNATWGHIAKEFVEADARGIEKLQVFTNTWLGEGWVQKGDAPEWERLYQRRESYPIGTVPAGAAFTVCGVDVQKGYLVFEVVAYGPGKESWSIDAGEIPGDTAEPGVWRVLDSLLNRTFPSEDGREMHIRMMAVDAGYDTMNVIAWCRKHPMDRVMAVRGRGAFPTLLGSPQRIDVTVRGRRLKRGYRYWPVGGNMAKSELYGWLRLDPPTEESGEAFPPGYCHHPEYGADYFKQLTAEQLQIHRKKTGFVTLEWEIIPGRENHYLDARVYARAAAALVGMDRFSDADWARLMGTPEPAPSKSEAVPAKDDDPAAAAQQRTRRQQMRESFLGDRSRGYWNRRR